MRVHPARLLLTIPLSFEHPSPRINLYLREAAIAVMRFSLLALLPAIAALQLPHIPTPQDALHAADAFLSSNVHTAAASLGVANDMNLAMIPQDEHVVITSARHPVRLMSKCEVPLG